MRKKLAENLHAVRSRIAEAATRAERDPDEITLLAVTKSVDLEVIRTLIDLGVTEFGENRTQQLTQRAGMIGEYLARKSMLDQDNPTRPPQWHMVGHVQRNKVKTLIPATTLIHSVDTLRLAEEINTHARRADHLCNVLIQINCSGEEQKFGMPVAAAGHFIEQIASMENIRVCGLMTMAPQTDRPEDTRPVFERLYEVFLDIKVSLRLGRHFRHLSMGMSQDFEVAVESGATIVRVGSSLFEGIQATVE